MTPLVLGPPVIPVITDPAIARSDPALALLSALCHDEGEHGREVVLIVEQTLVQSAPRPPRMCLARSDPDAERIHLIAAMA